MTYLFVFWFSSMWKQSKLSIFTNDSVNPPALAIRPVNNSNLYSGIFNNCTMTGYKSEGADQAKSLKINY